MNTVIRNGCLATAMALIHRYLTGPGAWVPHHMALEIVVTISGALLALTAILQLAGNLFGLAGELLRGEYR